MLQVLQLKFFLGINKSERIKSGSSFNQIIMRREHGIHEWRGNGINIDKYLTDSCISKGYLGTVSPRGANENI